MYNKIVIDVLYIYPACVVIATADIKILCNPWFTDGIHYGNWFQYQKINLYGIITCVFHWNDAEVYSPSRCKLVPNQFNRETHVVLDFLHV